MVVVFVFLLLTAAAFVWIYKNRSGKSHSYVKKRLKRAGREMNYFNFLALLILDKGILALLAHRFSQRINVKILSKFVTRIIEFLTGIEIYGNADIGRGVEIWHGNGVVIGQSAVIGENCLILQQVTIGGGFVRIGNNCKLGAGSKVLGNVYVGNHVVIAANSVVNKDTENHQFVGGVPARLIKIIKNSDEIIFGTKV